MKPIRMLLMLGACLPLAGFVGCASQNQGAATEENAALTGAGESQPTPITSPTLRPGMNPRDPRDPLFNTRNQPSAFAPPATQ